MGNKQDVNVSDLSDKILFGINLAFERLVKAKAKDNADLVFSKNGKIIHVKAKSLL